MSGSFVIASHDAQITNRRAHCGYGPFGEVIRATGPMAKLNPFTFQTEFYDWETDKIYWKHRFYDAGPGRFLSRDPVEEDGFELITEDDTDGGPDSQNGGNLYRFVNNNPITGTDALWMGSAHSLVRWAHGY